MRILSIISWTRALLRKEARRLRGSDPLYLQAYSYSKHQQAFVHTCHFLRLSSMLGVEPVTEGRGRADIDSSCLRRSYIWREGSVAWNLGDIMPLLTKSVLLELNTNRKVDWAREHPAIKLSYILAIRVITQWLSTLQLKSKTVLIDMLLPMKHSLSSTNH